MFIKNGFSGFFFSKSASQEHILSYSGNSADKMNSTNTDTQLQHYIVSKHMTYQQQCKWVWASELIERNPCFNTEKMCF